MLFGQFEDIVAWQEAKCLCKEVYNATSGNRDLGFNGQIQRAAVSVMNNIAEGFDRNTVEKENSTFIYFLSVAYASVGEVKSMCYLAEDLGYMTQEQSAELRAQCRSISNKIYALIQYLRNNPHPQSPKNKITK